MDLCLCLRREWKIQGGKIYHWKVLYCKVTIIIGNWGLRRKLYRWDNWGGRWRDYRRTIACRFYRAWEIRLDSCGKPNDIDSVNKFIIFPEFSSPPNRINLTSGFWLRHGWIVMVSLLWATSKVALIDVSVTAGGSWSFDFSHSNRCWSPRHWYSPLLITMLMRLIISPAVNRIVNHSFTVLTHRNVLPVWIMPIFICRFLILWLPIHI